MIGWGQKRMEILGGKEKREKKEGFQEIREVFRLTMGVQEGQEISTKRQLSGDFFGSPGSLKVVEHDGTVKTHQTFLVGFVSGEPRK